MTISKAFALTFGCAVVVEALRYVSPAGLLGHFLSVAGYLLLVWLGVLLGTHPEPYRTTFANAWPFVLLWFVVGILSLRFMPSEMPSGWTADDVGRAQWGYVLASIMFLPLAFAAGALGVWLRRLFTQFSKGPTNVA